MTQLRHGYERYFPPLTNRLAFSVERTPSLEPDTAAPPGTNRQTFRFEENPATATPFGESIKVIKRQIPPFTCSNGVSSIIQRKAPEAGPFLPSLETEEERVYDTPGLATNNQNETVGGPEDDQIPTTGLRYFPRPKGPLSKPKGGGYSLKDALMWDTELYRKVQVRITLHRYISSYFVPAGRIASTFY